MTVMTAPLTRVRDAEPFRQPPPMPVPATRRYVDPLDDDEPTDDIVVTTRRAISRVALVATEAASRFQREGVFHDPMTWMLAPRELFGGTSALDACLDRDACLRGVLLHGLSIGMDADPRAIDALSADDGDDDIPHGREDEGDAMRQVAAVADFSEGIEPEPRLFTATVVACDGFETVQAFHASLAVDEAEIAGRLYMRMGAAAADAVIVDGVDAGAPLVAALVAPAILDTLTMVAADPGSALAAGLDLNVEQRFLT